MVTQVVPQKVQKMEFDVTTSEGPGVTGTIPTYTGAASSGPQTVNKESFKVLLDPTLTPGKFRKATATASLSYTWAYGAPSEVHWSIEDAQATLDDETGQVQLVIDIMVVASGTNSNVGTNAAMFQVTTLAMV
jgi:hypothetical protein